MREFLAGFEPKDLEVQPVIVVPGWYVKPRGNYPVKVMNATYLVGYVKGMKRRNGASSSQRPFLLRQGVTGQAKSEALSIG